MSARAAPLAALAFVAAFGAAVFGATALAAPPHVIDYAGYSRVVTPLEGAARQWQIRRAPGMVRVILPPGTDTTPPAPLFSRRVTSVTPWADETGSGYLIRYSCDCEATAVEGAGGVLMVDLRGLDTPARAPAPAAPLAARPDPGFGMWPDTRPEPEPAANSAPRIVILPDPNMRFETGDTPPPAAPAPTRPAITRPDPAQPGVAPPTAARQETARPARSRAPRSAPLPRPRPPGAMAGAEAAGRVASLRDSVLEQIRRAAGQGVVTFDPSSPYTPIAPPPPEPSEGGVAGEHGGGSGGGSHGAPAHHTLPKPDQRPAACPDEDALDPTRWTSDPDFRTSLGALRSNLYDPLARIDPERVAALGRHYLAFGLGAEARLVARSFDLPPEQGRLLDDLGAIVEGEAPDPQGPVLALRGCGRRHAVWRAAALAGQDPAAMVAAYDATDAALRDLPGPLRKMLGGRIALAAFDAGDERLALRVWRALESADGPDTPEMRLLAAETRFEQGGTNGARQRLLALAEARGPAAPSAALRLAARLYPPGGGAMMEDAAAIIDDLSLVMRGHPDGAALVLAGARLRARYGDLAGALERLDREAARTPAAAGAWREAARELVRAGMATAHAGLPTATLQTLIKAAPRLEEDTGESRQAGDRARATFADVLTEAGVPNMAQAMLTPALLSRSAEAREAMARATLARGGAERPAPVTNDLFKTIAPTSSAAPLAGARSLIIGAEDDAEIIQELLSDG